MKSRKIKILTLYVLFVFNMSLTSIYFILDLLGKRNMNKLDFTFLLLYCVISMVIFGELLHEEKKKTEN
jgi:hypothetical protein